MASSFRTLFLFLNVDRQTYVLEILEADLVKSNAARVISQVPYAQSELLLHQIT